MSFVAPLFLVGLAMIGLPFWLHRLQTQSSERKPFSSAMLLETARQQVHVKKKLKYLVLLALRVLLLALAAFAFARPFISVPPDVIEATDAGTHLGVVDASASMSRAGVPGQAENEIGRAIDAAPNDALVQLLAVDSSLHVLGELTSDKSVPRARISNVEFTALRLDYGEAMTAVERFAASVPPPVTLHFVSDFQASGMPVRFSDLVPAGISAFVPHVVGTGDPFNWSVNFLRETGDGLQYGLTGAGDRERVADIELLLNGVVIDGRGLSQTGPQSVNFDLPEYEPGENRLQLRINTDDDFVADNAWHHVVDNDPPAAIPLITLNSGGLPVTYLSAALESAGDYRVESMLVGDFDTRILSRYRWAVIDDLGAVDSALEQSLMEFLQNGGNLLAFAGERAAGLEVLPVSGHRHSAPTTGTGAGEFISIGQIDNAHPVLSQTEGWQSVHVSRSMPLEPEADDQILIRLDNNEPFLIERRVGSGRLLMMPAHLDNRWSDLPVRPVFVSFVIEAARYLAGVNEIARTYTAGASLPLAVTGSTSGQVVDPDGNTILSLADTTREQQIKLNKPGIYEVYTSQGETLVAANIDPLESDLDKIDQEVLDRWQDAAVAQPESSAGSFSVEEDQTVELWHWILLILALVVIAESILGNMHLSPRRMERA